MNIERPLSTKEIAIFHSVFSMLLFFYFKATSRQGQDGPFFSQGKMKIIASAIWINIWQEKWARE